MPPYSEKGQKWVKSAYSVYTRWSETEWVSRHLLLGWFKRQVSIISPACLPRGKPNGKCNTHVCLIHSAPLGPPWVTVAFPICSGLSSWLFSLTWILRGLSTENGNCSSVTRSWQEEHQPQAPTWEQCQNYPPQQQKQPHSVALVEAAGAQTPKGKDPGWGERVAAAARGCFG